MKIELTEEEIIILVQALQSSWFPNSQEKIAFNLVVKLKALIHI